MRNRRHVARRGPLVVFNDDQGIVRAFRNLPGVEVCHVDRLNLLQLAPGGHLGRFVVWTAAAFNRLDDLFGSTRRVSTLKKGYKLPRPSMIQSDLSRLINSDEIQSKVRPAIRGIKRHSVKKNPLSNLGAMAKLNPYSMALRRSELLAQERRKQLKAALLEARRKKVPVASTPQIKTFLDRAASESKAAARHRKNMYKNYKSIAGTGDVLAAPSDVWVATAAPLAVAAVPAAAGATATAAPGKKKEAKKDAEAGKKGDAETGEKKAEGKKKGEKKPEGEAKDGGAEKKGEAKKGEKKAEGKKEAGGKKEGGAEKKGEGKKGEKKKS
jgi:hypothetical protein